MMWILAGVIFLIMWINFFAFFHNIFMNDPEMLKFGGWIAVSACLFGLFWPIAAPIIAIAFIFFMVRTMVRGN